MVYRLWNRIFSPLCGVEIVNWSFLMVWRPRVPPLRKVIEHQCIWDKGVLEAICHYVSIYFGCNWLFNEYQTLWHMPFLFLYLSNIFGTPTDFPKLWLNFFFGFSFVSQFPIYCSKKCLTQHFHNLLIKTIF